MGRTGRAACVDCAHPESIPSPDTAAMPPIAPLVGAVLVRDGEVIARAVNRIHETGDPTAHAELVAIREAAQALGRPRLDGCVVYASGHPCPMCLAAMHLCGIAAAYYAYSNEDG